MLEIIIDTNYLSAIKRNETLCTVLKNTSKITAINTQI